MKWLLVVSVLVGCTKHNPAVCCENDMECARVGFEEPNVCTGDSVCVANTCVAEGCDGDEDCHDAATPHCVSGACSAGCNGPEDCTDPDFPLCIANVCSVDCEARGGRIAFQSNRDGDDDVFVMFADGFAPVPMISNAANEGTPRWSPDGTRLAFSSDDDSDLDVYVTDFSATSPLNLSNNVDTDDNIEWSPDGTKVAFNSTNGGTQHARFALSDGTGTVQELVSTPDHNAEPSWSPDGNQLVFVSGTSPNDIIAIANSDGTITATLSQSMGDGSHFPRWSPDGTMIAVIADTTGALKVFTPNNSLVATTSADEGISDFIWMPDSKSIVMSRKTSGNRDLWSYPIGGNATRLTTEVGDDDHPRLSPDGTSLVFESTRDGNSEIYRMSVDGSQPANLTLHPGDDHFPDWTICPP